MANIDPKLIIGGAIAVPILYIWQEWEFSFIFLVALGAYAWNTFDNHYIHKSDVRERPMPQVGPEQPFLPQQKSWEIGPDGEPVAKYQPPITGYNQQRYRQ